jgi:hypothetical protein
MLFRFLSISLKMPLTDKFVRTDNVATPDKAGNYHRQENPVNSGIFYLYLNTKGKPPHLYRSTAPESNGIRNQTGGIHPNYLYLSYSGRGIGKDR